MYPSPASCTAAIDESSMPLSVIMSEQWNPSPSKIGVLEVLGLSSPSADTVASRQGSRRPLAKKRRGVSTFQPSYFALVFAEVG